MLIKFRGIVLLFFVILFSGIVNAGVIFNDGFESGSLNGWNLTTNSYTNITWNTSQMDPFSGIWHAESQPLDNHVAASNMERVMDTTGYTNISFSYYRKLVGLDGSDYWRVKWFDGVNWYTLEDNNGSALNDVNYTLRSFNLPVASWNNYNLKIRFECSVNAMSEYCRIDDVKIEGDSILINNYYGNFNYIPGYDYYVYINNSNSEISFKGLNVSNQFDTYRSMFDGLNMFVKRINYVWFSGWFDFSNLFMNNYVGAGVIYSGNAVQSSPGVYKSVIFMNNVPYLNLTSNVNVTLDMNNMKSTFDPISYPGQSTVADVSQDWQTAGHNYGRVLFETKLVNNLSNIQVNLWVKEDLAVNGMNPTWVNPIFVA
jgi:hypothetical protein